MGAEAPFAAKPSAPADRNVAVGSNGQYVPTVTAAAAWRVIATVSKATCDLDLLTLRVVSQSSHVWRGLPLCQF